MGLKDRLEAPGKRAKQVLERAIGQADDAAARAKAGSRAGVQLSKGDASFSAGAEAGAGSEADAHHGGDKVERLERLAALHSSGEIDDDEFAAGKRELLGG